MYTLTHLYAAPSIGFTYHTPRHSPFQEESGRVCDQLKSHRSAREEILLEIRREEERLNQAIKRREEEEVEAGDKAEQRVVVEKEWDAALQKLVRTRYRRISICGIVSFRRC